MSRKDCNQIIDHNSWLIAGSPEYTQIIYCFSVTESFLTLQPTGLQHGCFLSPPLSPRVCSNSCSLSQWGYLTTSSSAAPFSFCLQSFPASGSFPMSQFFASGGQSTRASASASILPVNVQDWFPLDLLVWSPCSPRDSQESSPTPQFESISFSVLSLLYGPALTSIHDYWKNHSFDYTDLCRKNDASAF